MVKKLKKPKYIERPYDFSVAYQLAQFVLSDYVLKFVEDKKLADFSLIKEFVKDGAFYLGSVTFVQEITKLYHDTEEDNPFSFDETKARIEQERSLLINRDKLAKEAKRDLQNNATNDVYKYALYKALYEAHFFDDETSKPLVLEELDYVVTEKKYSPLYLFLNLDQSVVNKINRLLDPEDRTIVSEVLEELRNTKKYNSYEFYFKACETRLNKIV